MSVLHHIFEHVLVTDCRLLIVDALLVKCFVKSKVGHDSCDDGIVVQFALILQITTADIEDLVSVHDLTLVVHCKTSVRITIKCKSHIKSLLLDKCLKLFNVC